MPKFVLTLLAVVALLHSPAAVSADGTIVVVGDSLSSGYGVELEQSWVALLEDRLHAEGYGYRVINASIAGDTSAGGLARLPRLLAAHSPAIVILELGGNDGLRALPVDRLRANLAAMIEASTGQGAEVILTGIQIPPNYGPSYTRAFSAVYPELAAEYDIALVDFLLDGVALQDGLMQADGIHPNARGHAVMFENVWSVLSGVLTE
jgi:acyl-CoA thioesterase I